MKNQKGFIDLSGLETLFWLAIVGLLAIAGVMGVGVYFAIMLIQRAVA
jgi:hypothetical protein